jgi:hypothetical protein
MCLYGKQTGNYGGFMVVVFFDDFQKFLLVNLRQRRDEQVIKHQHLALA